MNPQSNFLDLLLGGQSGTHFLAMLFIALFAATFSLLDHSTKRNINSVRTPRHFSWSFLYEDNFRRCVVSLMAILIGLRFLPELDWPVIGGEMNGLKALILGLGLDKFVQFLRSRTSIIGPKKVSE